MDEPADARFLEKHDLAVAKLIAGRPKDTAFVIALADANMLDVGVLQDRAEQIPEGIHPDVVTRVKGILGSLRRP